MHEEVFAELGAAFEETRDIEVGSATRALRWFRVRTGSRRCASDVFVKKVLRINANQTRAFTGFPHYGYSPVE